ncbi:hypothetical protein MMC06_001574 [Schaereria dolodes]|nr:hypothetical protein [Schaereria dolodes]
MDEDQPDSAQRARREHDEQNDLEDVADTAPGNDPKGRMQAVSEDQASRTESSKLELLHHSSPPHSPMIGNVELKNQDKDAEIGVLNGARLHQVHTPTSDNVVDEAKSKSNDEKIPGQEGIDVPEEPQISDLAYHDTSSLPVLSNGVSSLDSPLLDDSALSMPDSETPRIQAFAKLEFDDGQFYMNTHSIELGRDIEAARMAIERDIEAGQEQVMEGNKKSTSSADVPQTPGKLRRGNSRKLAGSIVSESGGILGADFVGMESRRPKSKKSKSTTSSSRNVSRKNSILLPTRETDYQSLAMASLADSSYGAYPVDPLSLLPSPDECPLVPIHPPAAAEGGPTGHRGISRKHAKIVYNFDKRLFELEIYGRNGAFLDEKFYSAGEVQPLKSGSYIQISGIGIRFVLPDVALGETGAEGPIGSDPASGGKMSFDFEDGRGESMNMANSSESESSRYNGSSRRDSEEPTGVEEECEENAEDSDVPKVQEKATRRVQKQKVSKIPKVQKSKKLAKTKPKHNPEPLVPLPKRKGPGRPPKNGIISKREQALLARQAREAAKAEATKDATSSKAGAGKGDNGEPRNHADLAALSPQPKPEKRKYTKRKKVESATDDREDIRETTERADSMPPERAPSAMPPKPSKEKKPPKPPRSPSPVFDEATLTPEQLAKPQQSYVVLIHEALSNSETKAMSLPQIYRAIERRYPFYKLRVQTQGWQSSVRHNLSQHPAFRKIERDGKGWMWGLVPEISIEKEKKRRPTPPPLPPQGYYAQPSHLYRHPYPYPGMPPANGQMHGPMGHLPYGMHPGVPAGQGKSPYSHLPGSISGPNGLPFPLVPPSSDSSSTYQSPYTPAPQPQPPLRPSSSLPEQSMENPATSQDGTVEALNGGKDLLAPRQHSLQQPNQIKPSPSPAPNGLTSKVASGTAPLAPPPPIVNGHTISQDVLTAVGKFKTALIASMPDKVYGEKIVTSAINRTLGIAPASNNSIKEDPQEKAVMQALSGMLNSLSRKSQEAQRQASIPLPQQQQQSHPPTNQLPSTQLQNGAQAQLVHLLQQIDTRAPSQAPSTQQQQHGPDMNGNITSTIWGLYSCTCVRSIGIDIGIDIGIGIGIGSAWEDRYASASVTALAIAIAIAIVLERL